MTPHLMYTPADVLAWQQAQWRHDGTYHTDIHCLHRLARLRHYGLHYGKYVGRLALQPWPANEPARTLSDTLLISLSAANTLSQQLQPQVLDVGEDLLTPLADHVGCFTDACEKLDHLEPMHAQIHAANQAIFGWALAVASAYAWAVPELLNARRTTLRQRLSWLIPEAV